MTIGGSAGPTAEVPFRGLQGRTHIGHYNNALPTHAVRDAYRKLTEHAAAGSIRIDVERFALSRALDAWHMQAAESPHRKLVIVP